jgi:hypothetical protein
VVGRLAHAYGDRLLGVHLNFLPLPLDLPFPAQLTEEDRAYQEGSITGRPRRRATA